MKIALIQFNASADKENNVRRAKEFVDEAVSQKAQWILLPEVFSFRGNLSNKDILAQAAETLPGPTSQVFQSIARENNVHILLGSMIEEAVEGKVYNTSVGIQSSTGDIAKYRKIHLFDAIVGDKIIRESDFFARGHETQVIFVGEFKVGLSICYDLRFSNLYHQYRQQKTDIMTVPSCFTRFTGQAHWESLLRARAIENLCYVIAPNQVGHDARGVQSHGHSMVISPWGEIVACGSSDQEEIIYADISLEHIKKARAILPGIIEG